MQEFLTASPGFWVAVVAVLAAGLGFAIGRSAGSPARRARALQAALAAERAEHEKARSEYDGYRKRVVDHFSETSEHLHDLTLQYRAVYEHLAKGATELCPEGFSKLEGGLGLDALPEEVAQRSAAQEIAPRPAPSPDTPPEASPPAPSPAH
jgi:uncharacterized membrane-anchored protein YhcB (DUF1043 family)